MTLKVGCNKIYVSHKVSTTHSEGETNMDLCLSRYRLSYIYHLTVTWQACDS